MKSNNNFNQRLLRLTFINKGGEWVEQSLWLWNCRKMRYQRSHLILKSKVQKRRVIIKSEKTVGEVQIEVITNDFYTTSIYLTISTFETKWFSSRVSDR